MNKTELTKVYRIRFSNLDTGEVEISIPDWNMRGQRNRLRVGRLNGNRFYVAGPGKSGTFRLSYQYEFNLPLDGTGPAAIKAHVLDSGCALRQFKVAERYLGLAVAAIDTARKMLKGNSHDRNFH